MKKIFTTLFAISAVFAASAQAPAPCSDLFISEYVEGDGNDKAIEIFNPTNQPKSLTGYFLRRYSNGNNDYALGGELALSGTIAPGDVWVIVNGQTTSETNSPAASPALQAKADQLDHLYPAPTYVNGNDAMVLEFGTTKVDIFGKIGEDPGSAWTDEFPYTDAAGSYWTKDHTLIRKASVTGGVTTNPANFNPTLEYDSLPANTWDSLGSHVCVCATGINETSKRFVSVFPNPSNNSDVTISAESNVGKVELIDRSGRIVATFTNEEKSLKDFRFSTTDIQKGFYIVKAYMGKNQIGVSKLSIN